ncbi:MarR family winged helix-turn-helix transcriptional regulator [Winogradskyella aurantia]|uniref:MarR family transcriptional regulator n=1 Tax=Winogradskyella aurantia TaxID=1915063 RepID=A0A265UVG2_9FLAO|nr:MarR family transcriptional regulator [Winogradskyella aurantia]OZV69067.1 MarR family transcriptional regulator [Winogradskyella aurantia]
MKELEQLLKTSSKLPLSRAAVINVFYTNNWIKDELLENLKPFELSLEQFNVLRILRGQNNKAINLQDIQERMVTKMSNTTRLVDKLIKKGYVNRVICKANRRKVEISITKNGLDVLKKIDPIMDASEAKVTKNLSKQDLEQLNKLLIKLRN